MLRILVPSSIAVALVVACGGRIAPLDTEPDAAPTRDQPDASADPLPQLEAGSPPDTGTLPDAAPPREAGPGADAGASSSGPYPAFKPEVPRAVSKLGPIMVIPNIIPVTFAGDPLAPEIEDFLSRIGQSSYWATVVAGYGVGAARMEAPIHLAESPPAELRDTEIEAWIATKLDGTHPEFPGATSGRIYAIFYPEGVTVRSGGFQSCNDFGGFHDEFKTAVGTKFAFVVIPRCPSYASFHGIDVITVVASHELLETATDPFPTTAPAFLHVDDAHFAWELAFGGEIGDLCSGRPRLTASAFGYKVQRQWSNPSIAGWHDPCVPVASGAYFNSAPVERDRLVFQGGLTTKATRIPINESRTIEIDLFSDAPTPGPWSVRAYDLGELSGYGRSLEVSLDHAQGSNGDRLFATVKLVARTSLGFSTLMIESTLGDRTTRWPTLIAY